jgi:hypothetical protein
VPAITEYLQVWDKVSEVILREEITGRFIWKWTPTGEYTARSAYRMLHAGSTSFPGSSLIWKIWAPMRVKIFLWLAFRRRHWTADRRIRHNLEASETCLLCDQEPETIDHTLCSCSYIKQVWWEIFRSLRISWPATPDQGSTRKRWIQLRRQCPDSKKKGFDSLFAFVSWQVWKEKNARLFDSALTNPTFQRWSYVVASR